MHNTRGCFWMRLVFIGCVTVLHALHLQTSSSSLFELSLYNISSKVFSLWSTGTINSLNSGNSIFPSWQCAQLRVVLNLPLPNLIQNLCNSCWTCISSVVRLSEFVNCVFIVSTSLRRNSWTSSVSSCSINVQMLVVVHHFEKLMISWNLRCSKDTKGF